MKSNRLMKFALRNGIKFLFVFLQKKEKWNKRDFEFIMDRMTDKEKNKTLKTLGVIYSVEELDEMFGEAF